MYLIIIHIPKYNIINKFVENVIIIILYNIIKKRDNANLKYERSYETTNV